MTPIKQKNEHYQTIKKTCLTANIAYLIFRIFYLILFIVSKLYVLVWVDAATILIYLLCFLLIKKKKYYLYALICGNEFFAFIIVATIFTGFETGFHFYLIGLCVVSFFTSYFTKKKNINHSIIWAGLSLIIYLVIYFVSRFNAPYYEISKWLEMTLLVTHVVIVFLFVVFYLVVFLKYTLTLESRIMNESRTDELTQISNRYGLYDYFDAEENISTKVLVLFDIDDFKVVNDTHGHVAGDIVLKKVAEIAIKTLENSFVCRYGGEEFVGVLDAEGHYEKLEALRAAVEKEVFEYEKKKFTTTITIGVGKYCKDKTLEQWVDAADDNMYLGKGRGKNTIVE